RMPNGALEVVCRVKAEPGAVAGYDLRRGAAMWEDKVGEAHVVRVLAAMACREQPDAGSASVADPRDADRLAHDVAVGRERDLGHRHCRCTLLGLRWQRTGSSATFVVQPGARGIPEPSRAAPQRGTCWRSSAARPAATWPSRSPTAPSRRHAR